MIGFIVVAATSVCSCVLIWNVCVALFIQRRAQNNYVILISIMTFAPT